MDPKNITPYSWPDLSSVVRQYVVRDDQGRIGIAYADRYHDGVLFAHPADMQPAISSAGVRGAEALPTGAVLLTNTAFHVAEDGQYRGTWCDYPGVGRVPPEDLRTLTVIDDLGWKMPDRWADVALAGSDQSGHWNYGATLGKVGGNPPLPGMAGNEMTVEQAQEYAKEVGEQATARGIRKAARSGYIPGARKIGRDWVISYDGFNHYLDNRPRPGRKAK